MVAAQQDYRDLVVAAADGLKLYARDYGRRTCGPCPVVCLPGLARTSADFHALALALARDPAAPRRVLALDYRGRGRSEWDPDWRNYDVRVEFGDVLQVLTVAGVEEAVFVGTSRGGLITMALAAARPTLLRGAVLNDIGPVVESRGLLRIKGYVGRMPQPRTWDEAAEIMQRLSDSQFPQLTLDDWRAVARGTYRETEAGLTPAYDPALLRTLETIDLDAPLPVLWFLFAGLKGVPVLALRGANSDVLSAGTLDAMAAAHPRLQAVTVADQGHAPLLAGPVLERVVRFVRELDAADQVAAA